MRSLIFLRRWMWAGLCAGLMVFRAGAQSGDGQQENRFLLVVETASSMRRSSNAVGQAITELFQSDMKGELRPGDTIGLWNYNDKLHTDFPMQIWKGTNGAHVQHNVMSYLRAQRYEKRGNLNNVLDTIGQVIAESHRLTVIFIFDGTQEIKGTPFDTDINNLHKKFGSEFRSEHVPFVTALSAREGNIFDYTVNTPGSIKLPHTAVDIKPEPTNSAPVAASAPPPVIPQEAPPVPHRHIEIVMSGPSAASAHPAAAAVEAPAAPTNQIVAPPESHATVVAPSNATPLETNAVVEPKIVAESETNTATNAVAAPVVTAPAPPPARPLPTAQATPEVAPATPAGAVALAPPQRTVAALVALFIIAFSLLAIAVGLFWSLARRARGGGSPSLISQSMDRSR